MAAVEKERKTAAKEHRQKLTATAKEVRKVTRKTGRLPGGQRKYELHVSSKKKPCDASDKADSQNRAAKRLSECVDNFFEATMQDPEAAKLLYFNQQLAARRQSLPVINLERDAQKRAIDKLQKHWSSEMGMCTKAGLTLSYEKMQQLTHLLSFDYEPVTEYDGKHTRLDLGDDIPEGLETKVRTKRVLAPVMPGEHTLRKEAGRIAGKRKIEVSDDQTAVVYGIHEVVAQRLKTIPEEEIEFDAALTSKEIKRIQVLGDGYRQYKRMKIVNLAVRVHGATKTAGAIDALDPIGLWHGDENYHTIKERSKSLLEYMEQVHKNGGIKTD